MRFTIAISFALAFASLVAHADVYRWVDATGEEHYSDRPIEGAELIRTTAPRPPGATSASPRVATAATPTSSASPEAASTRAAEKEVAKDLAAQRSRDCADSKARYEKSLQARRIFRTLENGEREYLTDAEADKVRVANRAAMDAACGKAPAAR
ncbi:MAG: hypothetical protein CMLOHMNK_03389 [Steroidobacteraceae bacterium]|nr:hypothetical protein [Steroidobacteraceae bacterium]